MSPSATELLAQRLSAEKNAAATNDSASHEYGVTAISDLSDREIAEETLHWLRQTAQALAVFQQQGMGGIMKVMMGGTRR